MLSGKETPLALTALYPVATSVWPVLGEYEELGLVGHTSRFIYTRCHSPDLPPAQI